MTSVENPDVVHAALKEGNDKKTTVRGKPLRELKDFLESEDPGLKNKKNGDFAGLHRIGDPDQGIALWTKLTDPEDIEKALKERTRLRKEEEARQLKEKEDKQKGSVALARDPDTPLTGSDSTAPVGSESDTAGETSVECKFCMIMRSILSSATKNCCMDEKV